MTSRSREGTGTPTQVLILGGGLVLTMAPDGLSSMETPPSAEQRLLLTLIDGRRSIRELAQQSGMSQSVAAGHLRPLFEQGVLVTLDRRAPAAVGAMGVPNPLAEPGGDVPPKPLDRGTPRPVRAGAAAEGARRPATPTPGSNGPLPFRVGAYEVVTRIGQGGMGSIYVCRRVGAVGFERLFALKVVRQHSGQEELAIRSFINEGRIGGRLHHANLQSVVDVGTYNGQPFLVLEYIEGASLADLLADHRRLPAPVVVTVLLDMLRGLQRAHDLLDEQDRFLGLVHGDVSTHNVLVGSDGVARLTDFGSARFTANTALRQSDPLPPGKPAYMAPEQLRAEAIDARADIFAAGVVMWTALTGEELFAAESYEQVVLNVLRKRIPPPSQLGAPPALDEICLRALSRTREARYANAEEMATALLKAAAPADLVAPPRRVGEHVRGQYGEVLADRRRRIQAAFSSATGTTRPEAAAAGQPGSEKAAGFTVGVPVLAAPRPARQPAVPIAKTMLALPAVEVDEPVEKSVVTELAIKAVWRRPYVYLSLVVGLTVFAVSLVIVHLVSGSPAGPAHARQRSALGAAPVVESSPGAAAPAPVP
jgi:serine/threonine-protein kinase